MKTRRLGSIALAGARLLSSCCFLLASRFHVCSSSDRKFSVVDQYFFIDHEAERTVTGASVGIIGFSHDSSIDKWRVGSIEVQPQVWLAVFSTIINALLGFSLIKGANLRFWNRARRGTTVSQRLLFFPINFFGWN